MYSAFSERSRQLYGSGDDAFLRGLASELERSFGIHHATIQIEKDRAACSLADGHVH